MRVRADDPEYQYQARLEAAFWEHPPVTISDLEARLTSTVRRFLNACWTGDPDMSWLQHLVARGPYRKAAMLGSTGGQYERLWLAANASKRLDVYELSHGVIRSARQSVSVRRLGFAWPNRRVRFIPTDLNFAVLPSNHYDVIWTTVSVHHVTNLEHLFQQIDRALRPGGLFALYDYVGEPALAYGPERLRLANDVLARIPVRFRAAGIEAIARPSPDARSPFEAVRSDEILPMIRRDFDIVHCRRALPLFPLLFQLELHRMEDEVPELLDLVLQAERDAQVQHGVDGCLAYVVGRKRGVAAPATP